MGIAVFSNISTNSHDFENALVYPTLGPILFYKNIFSNIKVKKKHGGKASIV